MANSIAVIVFTTKSSSMTSAQIPGLLTFIFLKFYVPLISLCRLSNNSLLEFRWK